MLKAWRKGTASFNHLGGEETIRSEMFLKGGKREQISNRVVRNHNVEGGKTAKVERSSKGRVVVESLANTRRRVVMNNSAENWSGSSTEEESDEKEDLDSFHQYLIQSEGGEENLAIVEKELAAVRARLLGLEAEKLAALDCITETDSEDEKGLAKEEEWSSQSDAGEFFGINQEGKAVALMQEPASSRPELNCCIVEESTTEEESEDECEEGFTPQSGEFDNSPRRGPARRWSPHTPRFGKREGRGRGKQVILSYLCLCGQSHCLCFYFFFTGHALKVTASQLKLLSRGGGGRGGFDQSSDAKLSASIVLLRSKNAAKGSSVGLALPS